jgi:hypothetical protein
MRIEFEGIFNAEDFDDIGAGAIRSDDASGGTGFGADITRYYHREASSSSALASSSSSASP